MISIITDRLISINDRLLESLILNRLPPRDSILNLLSYVVTADAPIFSRVCPRFGERSRARSSPRIFTEEKVRLSFRGFFSFLFFLFFFFFWKFTYLSTFENGGTCHSKVVYRSFVFKSNSIYCTVLRCIVSCRVRFILKNLLLKFVVRFSSPFFSSAELQTLRWNNEMLFSVSWISSNARKFWGRLDSSNLSLKEIFHCFWRYESFHGRWNLRIKGKNPGQVIVEHCSHVPNVSKIRRYNSGKIAFAKQ